MTEHGRYVRAALADQRAARPLVSTSGVHTVTAQSTPADTADQQRRLYEQIGTLYQAMEAVDVSRFGDETATQELTAFLETVRAALRLGHYSGTHAALSKALRRYEADRGGA